MGHYPTKNTEVQKIFKGLAAKYVLEIKRNYEKGRSPFDGYDCEEDYRYIIDDSFDDVLKDNLDSTLQPVEIEEMKHEYLDTILEALDRYVDRYEKTQFYGR